MRDTIALSMTKFFRFFADTLLGSNPEQKEVRCVWDLENEG